MTQSVAIPGTGDHTPLRLSQRDSPTQAHIIRLGMPTIVRN
jgi:hypothetical protein